MDKQPKNVQIPTEMFLRIAQYFYADNHDNNLYRQIKKDCEAKIDALMRHQYYSEYKTADSEQDREQARQKYLEMVGMHKSFKWSQEYDQNRK